MKQPLTRFSEYTKTNVVFLSKNYVVADLFILFVND